MGFCVVGSLMGALTGEARTLYGGVYVSPLDARPGIVGFNCEVRPGEDAVIIEVYPETPAQKAGIIPGDRIVRVNQALVRTMSREDLDRAISDRPGDLVTFDIRRAGQMRRIGLFVAPAQQD